MFEDVGLQPPEHVRAQHVVQLLDLVLLRDVGELLQEDLQFAADGKADRHRRVTVTLLTEATDQLTF